MLLVVLAIEEVLVNPRAAPRVERDTLAREINLAQRAGHFSRGPQGAEVPEAHLWIWPEVFDIHGIVLAAFHYAILVGVPAAWKPAEFKCPACLWPEAFKPVSVSGQFPVAVELHQAAHLSIG